MQLLKNKIANFYRIQWLVFSCLFIVFYNKYLYSFGPDFVSYHAIAKQIKPANFYETLNAWWSPLYSWLLALFYAFIKDPLLANKLLQYIIGWFIFLLFKRMLKLLVPNSNAIWAESILFSSIPFLVVWVLKTDTPDLLSACLLLYFFYLTVGMVLNDKVKKGILAGIIGGLAVWAKAYNFYFLLSFSFLTLIFFLVKYRNSVQVWKSFLSIATPFMLITAALAFLIYAKSGKFQISSIAIHELCVIDFQKPNQEPVQPYDCSGLGLDPTSLISNWENPSLYPAKSIGADLTMDVQKTSQRFLHNGAHAFQYYFSFYSLLLLCILFIKKFDWVKRTIFLWAAFFAVYCAGYFLLHIELRFFILPLLLVMILVMAATLQVIQDISDKKINWLLTALVILLFIKTPLQQLITEKENALPKTMKEFAGANSFAGTNTPVAASKGNFEPLLYFCFFTGNKCIGALNVPDSTKEAKEALEKNKATFILTKDSTDTYRLLPFP